MSTHIAYDTVPYLHDVAEPVDRVSESMDPLREELTSILELNMSLQNAEPNQVMKKLAAWAEISAAPTAATEYFGQNIPDPGFGDSSGLWQSVALIAGGAVTLWWRFRRVGWL